MTPTTPDLERLAEEFCRGPNDGRTIPKQLVALLTKVRDATLEAARVELLPFETRVREIAEIPCVLVREFWDTVDDPNPCRPSDPCTFCRCRDIIHDTRYAV